MMRRVRKLWNTSPAELAVIVSRRCRNFLGTANNGWDYSLAAVVRNPKHMNTKLEIERWERMWRICKLRDRSELEGHFDFQGKVVLEVGCGPVLGVGPIALFRGAKNFLYKEPGLVRGALESKEIKQAYFAPLHSELVANYGDLMAFEQWYSKVIDLSRPFQIDTAYPVDLTVSHSVLEHIPRSIIENFVKELYEATKPGGWFVHIVDFGPHGHGDGQMVSLYKSDWQKELPNLNLFRKSDIENTLRGAGFEINASLPYKLDQLGDAYIHDTWRKYSSDDLAHRVVFIFGERPT